MDIKLEIEPELWTKIQKNYENENYSGALIDSMYTLTETIRNKSGLEGDGESLVGQAFGGNNPVIKLNKLQTDSERNVQKGINEILKGLYAAIRNPRSHDKSNDTKQEADAVITFINYLLNIIDNSKTSFEEDSFLERVYDKFFVKTKEYADLLVAEIPNRQRANIAIKIILDRKKGDISILSYFMSSLFDKLDEPEITRVYKVISDELKCVTEELDIITILGITSAKYWIKVDKAVSLRIENILFEDIKAGTFNKAKDTYGEHGTLGTWAYTYLPSFSNKSNWTKMLVKKLESDNEQEKDYVNKWFWGILCLVNRDEIHIALKTFIKKAIIENNTYVLGQLEKEIIFDKNHPWWKVFEEELKTHPEIKYCDLPV